MTDKDDMAANRVSLGDLTNLFAWTIAGHLTFNLRNVRCGTDSIDDGSKFAEDLVSIADLSAGAFNDFMNYMKYAGVGLSEQVTPVSPNAIRDKSRTVLLWYSEKTKWNLKRILLGITSGDLNARWRLLRLNIARL